MKVPPEKAGFFLPLLDLRAALLPIPRPLIFVYLKNVPHMLNAGLGIFICFLILQAIFAPAIPIAGLPAH